MPQHSSEHDVDPPALPTGNGHTPRSLRLQRRARVFMARSTFGVAAGALVVLLLGLPVRFPYVVSTFAAVTPEHRWVLSKTADGQLIASTFNYRSGLSEGYRVSTFNPGSSISFALQPSLTPGQTVAMGDTIGSLYSSEVAERLISLNGQLAAARNMLAVNASGQKDAVVKEAVQRLLSARRRRDEYQHTLDRAQKLFDQHVISAGEYEPVRSEANALDDEITIAQAAVEAAQTGAKPEQLELMNTNIAALQSEIAAVKGRAATYTVTAPITGLVTPTFSPDTLVTIAGPEYLALIPVRWTDSRHLAATPGARLTVMGITPPVHGTVIALNPELHVINGRPVVIAIARLDAAPAQLMPGMLLPCRIHCAPVTAAAWSREFLASLTASAPLAGAP